MKLWEWNYATWTKNPSTLRSCLSHPYESQIWAGLGIRSAGAVDDILDPSKEDVLS